MIQILYGDPQEYLRFRFFEPDRRSPGLYRRSSPLPAMAKIYPRAPGAVTMLEWKATDYAGFRDADPYTSHTTPAYVYRGFDPLPLYRERCFRSFEFNWGYQGSGPAQTAFAILYDYLRNQQWAEMLYPQFKDEIIATLPPPGFVLSTNAIELWLDKLYSPKCKAAMCRRYPADNVQFETGEGLL